jgi:hypothetical protein
MCRKETIQTNKQVVILAATGLVILCHVTCWPNISWYVFGICKSLAVCFTDSKLFFIDLHLITTYLQFHCMISRLSEKLSYLVSIFLIPFFSMESHVNYILTICAQRSYLLKLLSRPKQGLPALQMNTVFYHTVILRTDNVKNIVCYSVVL